MDFKKTFHSYSHCEALLIVTMCFLVCQALYLPVWLPVYDPARSFGITLLFHIPVFTCFCLVRPFACQSVFLSLLSLDYILDFVRLTLIKVESSSARVSDSQCDSWQNQITIHTLIHTLWAKKTIWPNLHVFKLYKEIERPRGNTGRHKERRESLNSANRFKPKIFLLWDNSVNHLLTHEL